MSTVLTWEIVAVTSLAAAVVMGLVITMIQKRLEEEDEANIKA